jgi:hypothetical protein
LAVASKNPSNDPWAGPALTGRAAKKAAKTQAKAAKTKKTRWYKQIAQVYQMVAKHQPLIWLWLVLIVVGLEGVAVLFGAFVWKGRIGYMAFLAAPVALLVCTMFLARRAEAVAYGQIEGQPGATASALGTIRRGWTIEQEPVAADPGLAAIVFRAVGRPGVVLIGEGKSLGKIKGLLAKERKRVARVAPGVNIHELTVGRGEDQVPLPKLVRKLKRLRPSLNKAALAEVNRRLQSIGGMKLPIPKGVDPLKARPDRRALRGK